MGARNIYLCFPSQRTCNKNLKIGSLSNDDDDAEDDALSKMIFLFYKLISRMFRSVQYARNGYKNLLRLNMQRQRTVPNGNVRN